MSQAVLERTNSKSFLGVRSKILLLFAVSIFFDMDWVYFNIAWYGNSRLSTMASVLAWAATFLLLFEEMRIQGQALFTLTLRELVIMFIAIAVKVHGSLFGAESNFDFAVGDIRLLLVVYLVIKMSPKRKKILFEYIIELFLLFATIGLIYYLICVLGLQRLIPHSVIARRGRRNNIIRNQQFYYVFPMGVVLRSGGLYRYCAIFDEPGVLGTISALLYAGSYKGIKKRLRIPVLLIGILTLSTAFYIIIAVFYLWITYTKKMYKTLIAIAGVLIVYGIIYALPNDILLIKTLQEKMLINTLFSRRDTKRFLEYYRAFIAGGGYPLLMGMGKSAHRLINDGTYSYKLILYDYGIIGSILYISLFIQTYLRDRSKEGIVFFLCFMISIFQRPFVYTTFFYPLFVTALSSFNYEADETSEIEEYEAQWQGSEY